jgi:PAS domain S-box-containing protein
VTIERDFPKPVVAYGAALAAVAVALFSRLALAPWLGPTNPYLSFFPAVLAASWFGGFGPGAVAAGLCSAASFVWFLQPIGLFKLPPAYELNALALFTVVSIGIAYLSGVTRKAQVAARRSAVEWRTTLASIGDAVIVTDRHGLVRFLNPVAERLTGWTLADALGTPLDDVFAVVDEHTSQRVESVVSRVLRENRSCALAGPVVLRHRSGRRRPIADSAAPVRNEAGDIDGVVLVFRDQSAERESSRELRRSRMLLQTMSDRTPAVTYVKDLDGRYLFVNQSFLELFGVTQSQAVGRTDVDLFGAEIGERFRSMDRRVLQANAALTEEEFVQLESGRRTYLSVKCPLWDEAGTAYGVFGLSTEITERKRIEDELLESRRHYQALAESLPHLVWTCRADGYCDYLSRQWQEYTGRPAEAQLGDGWTDAIHPDDRARVEREWRLAVQRGDLYDEEFRLRRHDGRYRWFRTRAVPLHDATGTPVKWFGSNIDVEDYKRSEQRLRAQVERLDLLDRLTRAIGERQDLRGTLQVVVRSLEDHLPLDYGCVCLYDAVERTLTVECVGERGAAIARDTDLEEHALVRVDANGLSKCVSSGLLVYEPDIEHTPTAFARRLASGGIRSFVAAPLVVESQVFGVLVAARRVPDGFTSAECEFLRQLSEHVALAAHQAQLHTALQRAYDDLHQTQQAVMQQERLKALGQMASGIAHDINNAISPVTLYTESLLENETGLSPRARDYLETIQRATEDVAQTVARMREFYRPPEAELVLSPVDLNQVARDVIGLTRARWSDMPQERGVVIELDLSLAATAPIVPGVEAELREALTNLVFNAVDAMPEGGTLSIRTRRTSDPSREDAPDRVYIEVSDTGVGMDADTQRRCLEPFFTTKGERGTGLGLATVYGSVQRHNAEIYIVSAPGRGTTVQLVFAPAREDAPVTRQVPPRARSPRQRVLVVDDDPMLLKSLRDALESDGHDVATASGGLAGLEAFSAARDAGAPFGVVITDLGMPYMDGRQVASGVKELSPSTAVVLLTGWGQRMMDDGERPTHVDRILTKPPRLTELRAALAALATAADG